MKRERFERLVEEALEEIPEKFTKLFENITVMVQDRAPRDVHRQTGTSHHSLILGTYHGVPYKHRGPYYGNTPPDVITIYQESIERICSTDDDIKIKVREVVLHEVGHYFGLKEKDLRDIEER